MTTFTKTKDYTPMGEYKPTEIDEMKAKADYLIIAVEHNSYAIKLQNDRLINRYSSKLVVLSRKEKRGLDNEGFTSLTDF